MAASNFFPEPSLAACSSHGSGCCEEFIRGNDLLTNGQERHTFSQLSQPIAHARRICHASQVDLEEALDQPPLRLVRVHEAIDHGLMAHWRVRSQPVEPA